MRFGQDMFMKIFSLLFISFFIYDSSSAQEVQWASEVIKFSTEFSRKEASAKQVLGKPDKLPAWGPSNVAWAPQKNDNEFPEFIHVGFSVPIKIKQVAVGESYNPGSIIEILLYDVNGKKYTVYKNDTLTGRFSTGGGMFHVLFPITEYEVKSVKVILNTKAIPGSNQIDCIGISSAETPIEALVHEIEYKDYDGNAENLGSMVNSRADDMLPIISPDGKILYFGRKLHPDNIGDEKRDDIWFSIADENMQWTEAQHALPPLNNEHHNYVIWVSADGKKLALANDYKNPGKNNQTVSMSQFKDGLWQFPKALPINDMYSTNEFSCYTLNTEGTILLLAIQRPESLGDMDIYVSMKQKNGAWTKPKNIGSMINTAATEGSVFLAADNRTIYFASNGHSGYGGFDMFMSKRLDDTWLNWSEPLNLGKKINSKNDDFYYTIPASGDYAYFSSRENSMGGADLFRIKLPKEIQPDPVTLLQGKIIDAETKQPIDVNIEFGGLVNEEPKGALETINGNYQIIIPQKDYEIKIKKEGYFPVTTNIDLEYEDTDLDFDENDSTRLNDSSTISDEETIPKEFTTQEEVIEINPLKEGQIIQLNNVFFDANKATLKEISLQQLDEVALFLLDNPKIYVEIGGHTNGLPADDFCQRLSDDRAKTVAEYFMKKGISAERVTFKGYGKKLPIADNSTIEGRKKNQRVELKIIEIRK